MNTEVVTQEPVVLALEIFRPRADEFYTLDATAMLAGVTRRALLMYCRAGFLVPYYQAPFGVMVFTWDAIHAVRRIEEVRAYHRLELSTLAAVLGAFGDLECLHAELHGRSSARP